MNILVTGGAGFIGSHVVKLLVKSNHDVSVLVSGVRSKKHPRILDKSVPIIRGDLRDKPSLEKATKDMDYVFHLAAISSHYCDAYPELAINVNVKGTWNLKQACITNHIKRVFFASTSFIYKSTNPMTHQHIPISEMHSTAPKELYGVTKLAGENILQTTYPSELTWTILRLFNVYGPFCYLDKLYTAVIPTWMSIALKKQPLEIHADGTQRLDFVYVEDVAQAFVDSLSLHAENQTFNVGSGVSTSMNQLAYLINTITENQSKSYYNPNHPAYLKYVQADISKIKRTLGWIPQTSLRDGLTETAKFFRGEIN